MADKYRITRMIGVGGMGGVFEATHEQLGKRVAVKLLRPEYAFDREMVVRFMREARAAAGIGHPCIVDIYDIGSAPDGSLFLVMELLEGRSLAELLERHPVLEVPLATYGACQVLSALEAAHRKDIVHRDIKPANILLVRTGQALPDVKLLDFGISKMLEPASPGSRLTKTGAPVGTPSYMSPEQVLGEKDVDRRADIYGVGVLLYRCVTGRLPFVGDENEGVYYKIIKGSFQAPREVRPDLPAPFEAVLLRAMARNREERFQSAAEMLDALLVYLDPRAADRVVIPEGMTRRSSAPGLPGQARSTPPASAVTTGAHAGAHSSRRPSRGGGLALPIAVVLGAATVVLLVAALVVARPWQRGRGSGERPTVTTVTHTEAVPAVLPQPAPSPPVGPDQSGHGAPDMVELRVTVDPPEARIRVDRGAVEGNPFVGRFPRDGAAHRVEASADGYQDSVQFIRFDEDRALSFSLLRADEEERGGRRSLRRPEPSEPTVPTSPVGIKAPVLPISNAPRTSSSEQSGSQPSDPGLAGNPFGAGP